MRPIYLSWAAAILLAACSDDASSPTGSDEESAQQFGKDETYDHTRAGARLILSYDAEANAFAGTVQNTTDATLRQVRVEVHLSNGTELGPTPEADLEPGETIPITLEATSDAFDTWSAHPEVGGGDEGSGEHSGEGDGEHSREGGGEHSGEGGEGGESGGEHSSG
ncbi:MAG: FxLYD domain-containing protein [Gemmatimonadaceae bacterium]|nr:FxLYD domain-containing protein [Gemmatimonadaceae bacterium]